MMMNAILGFNPCFIGLASATVEDVFDGIEGAVFQSLFYWISLCNSYHILGLYDPYIVSILVLLD